MGSVERELASHFSESNHSSSSTQQGVVLGEPPRGACSRGQEGHNTSQVVSIHQGKPAIKVLSKHKLLHGDAGQMRRPNKLPLDPWSNGFLWVYSRVMAEKTVWFYIGLDSCPAVAYPVEAGIIIPEFTSRSNVK